MCAPKLIPVWDRRVAVVICKDEATRSPTERIAVTLSPLLLEVLVCPECKSSVTVDETSSELVCDDCGLIYPIRDGIPIMLIEAARRPDDPTAAADVAHAEAGDDTEASDDDAADAADTTDTTDG
jgi:hypothetical protein